MALIDKETIRAEIERLKKHYRVREEYDYGWKNALNAISKFLDTLPEQVNGPSRDQVGTKFAVEGLEEEIDRFENWMETYNQADYPTSYTTRDIARHFAEWGRKQVLQEIYDGKVKPVDKVTAAWIDDERNT